MPDYGFKVSNAGFNVKTANSRQLAYSTKYDTLKPYLVGYGEGTVGAAAAGVPGYALVQISHGLGYKPICMGFTTSQWRTGEKYAPYSFKSIGAASPDGVQWEVDNDTLFINLYNGDTSSRQIFFRYHIYYNELI